MISGRSGSICQYLENISSDTVNNTLPVLHWSLTISESKWRCQKSNGPSQCQIMARLKVHKWFVSVTVQWCRAAGAVVSRTGSVRAQVTTTSDTQFAELTPPWPRTGTPPLLRDMLHPLGCTFVEKDSHCSRIKSPNAPQRFDTCVHI